MKLFKISNLILILSLGPVFAQTFTGNYILHEDVVKLILEQQSSGMIIGQLSGNGLSFELEGELSPDDPHTAYGYVYTDESNYLFAIVLEEPVLNMILFSILENGEPNPDDSETFFFDRVDNLGPGAANPQAQVPASNPTAPIGPVTAPATNRLPTINSPTTPAPAASTETQSSATQNPVASNPLASTPASTGSPSQNPLVMADPFNGTFEGDGLKLILIKSGTTYSGSLDFRGNKYPVTAIKKLNGLVGNFKVGDKLFSFSAALENNKLTLVSDGAIYALIKK